MREKQPELSKHAPPNALRHCYVSHYLCLHGSIDALLLQSAHSRAAMLTLFKYCAQVRSRNILEPEALNIPQYPLRLFPYPLHCEWLMESLAILAKQLGKSVEEVTAEIEASCGAIETAAKTKARQKKRRSNRTSRISSWL